MARRRKEPVTANATETVQEEKVVKMTPETQEEVQEEVQTEEVTEEAQPDPELTLGDLTMLRNIIELASSRGAFRGNELEVIGKAFNKLNAFLVAVTPKTEESEENTETDEKSD